MIDQTLQDLQREYLARIENHLETQSVDTDFALTSFCCYAGRLASLGVEKYMEKAQSLLTSPAFAGRVDAIFRDRIAQGLEDLDHQWGEELGISLEEAQDFHCFFRRTTFSFEKETLAAVQEWMEFADHCVLDEEAVETLEEYQLLFPIAEEDMLVPIAAPVAEGTMELASKRFLPDDGQTWTAHWNEWTKRCVCQTVHGYCFLRCLSRTEEGCVYEFTGEDGRPVEVFHMNQGILPLRQNPEIPEEWTADYTLLPFVSREEIERSDISVQLAGGGRLVFPVPFVLGQPKIAARSEQATDFWLKVRRSYSVGVAAATFDEDDFSEWTWRSDDGQWIAVGMFTDETFRILFERNDRPTPIQTIRWATLEIEISGKDRCDFFRETCVAWLKLADTSQVPVLEILPVGESEWVPLRYIPMED
ncbi:MAG: hypothetical protein Q4D98_08550 [Planctomycetia bacterium]|nr:hypothetical protein [Planctomycetia bacterium]